MTQSISSRVKTPCIGVCSTGLGDTVCRGCKRFSHEIIQWNSFTESQKHIIDSRLSDFLAQIVESKLHITDPSRLQWHLQAQQIPFSSHKAPSIWVYELLRAGASQIGDPREYGIVIDAQYQSIPLAELRKIIDEEFYLLSEAHYQRYFSIESVRKC